MESNESLAADEKGRVEATGGVPLARQLALYFGGLLAVYVLGVVIFFPATGEAPNDLLFLVVMFAPTAGAILVSLFGGGRIRWGRPTLWIAAGLIPAVAVLGTYLLSAAVGWTTLEADVLGQALVAAPIGIATACISAIGEEIGWRGFLWPTLRQRFGFWWVSLVVGVVWWAYHVPLILAGWYGTLAGLPAFTVAIAGFTLFVGVITDRSRGLWASVIAHGAWNALVATSFAARGVLLPIPAFAGSEELLGEFGWLAAITMVILGVGAAWWHLTHPLTSTQTEGEASR